MGQKTILSFYGNSLDVAGYLALGSKKANGNDKEIEGGGGGELEVLRKVENI